MTAKPVKGFAAFDGSGAILWATLHPSAAEAERRFKRWNAVDQFPESFAGWSVRPVTITPDAPAPNSRRASARCRDTEEMFPERGA